MVILKAAKKAPVVVVPQADERNSTQSQKLPECEAMKRELWQPKDRIKNKRVVDESTSIAAYWGVSH
jgi:hypothetical protein